MTAVHAACRAGLGCRLGAGHGEERTPNIWCMVVTLEVSRLSGWLNAVAYCRESHGGHTVRGEVQVGRQQGGGRARSVQGRSRLQIEGRAHGEERTRNIWYIFVTLEVSRLSGWLNAVALC